MRLILIDNASGFIFGDSLSFPTPPRNVLASIQTMDDKATADHASSLIAAMATDMELGAGARRYVFSRYPSAINQTGYAVWEIAEGILPLVANGQDRVALDIIQFAGRNVGFVACQDATDA